MRDGFQQLVERVRVQHQLRLSTDPAVRDGFQQVASLAQRPRLARSQQIPLCGMDFNQCGGSYPRSRKGSSQQIPLCGMDFNRLVRAIYEASQVASQQIPLCGMDFNAQRWAQRSTATGTLNRSRCAGWISTQVALKVLRGWPLLSTDPAVRDGFQPATKPPSIIAPPDSQQIPLCGMDFNKASAVVPYGTLALSTDPAVRDGFQRQL